MRRYRKGSHTKHDLKVHLIWCTKYRHKGLEKEVGYRLRELLRQMEFPQLGKLFWGKHLWGIGYAAFSAGTVTDEMIQEYLAKHEEKDADFTVEE